MATIKGWLDEAGFDYESGRVIIHPCQIDEDGDPFRWPGWAESGDLSAPIEVGKDHPVLSDEFDSGHGGPMCPRFIAEDKDRIYFPEQYDGATSLAFVWKDIMRYMAVKSDSSGEHPMEMTPYPGG